MRIEVNGIRLFVDIVGSGLVAAGTSMTERPTIFLLHGGPGMDHTAMKPDFDPLSEVCLLYTSPSPRDVEESRMPSSA